MKSAIIVFVKTPEYSPIKTRLAAKLGQQHTLAFYQHALKATRAIVREVQKIHFSFDFYWAVAEKDAMSHPFWQGEKSIEQYGDDLGERLYHVYKRMIQKYQKVYFIGADSPHLSPDIFTKAEAILEEIDYVLGPCEDGGYYLFAGKKNLPRTAFTEVCYSTAHTCEMFSKKLKQHGNLHYLPINFDIDNYENLLQVLKADQKKLLPAQRDLHQWIEKNVIL